MFGFQPVAKVRFDDQFAPKDWNYERDGRPDIIFWIHNGESWEKVIENLATYPIGMPENYCKNYEEARNFRDMILMEKLAETINASVHEVEAGAQVLDGKEVFKTLRDKYE